MLFLSWSFWEEVGETSGATTSTLGPPHLRAATSTLKLTHYLGAATYTLEPRPTPRLLHVPLGCYIYPGAATSTPVLPQTRAATSTLGLPQHKKI